MPFARRHLRLCVLFTLFIGMCVGWFIKGRRDDANLLNIFVYQQIGRMTPRGPEIFSYYDEAVQDAADVLVRNNCDSRLSYAIARASRRYPVSGRLIAAVIVHESHCSPYAVSRAGAVGEMQILVRQWCPKYNCEKNNLFNPEENIDVGTRILSGLIQQYGVERGLRLYNGVGFSMDIGYPQHVIKIARSKK